MIKTIKQLESEIEEWNKAKDKCFSKFMEKEYSRQIFENESKTFILRNVIEIVEELNEKFRKENTPQRLSGDEFNDLWEEELKRKLLGMGELRR